MAITSAGYKAQDISRKWRHFLELFGVRALILRQPDGFIVAGAGYADMIAAWFQQGLSGLTTAVSRATSLLFDHFTKAHRLRQSPD